VWGGKYGMPTTMPKEPMPSPVLYPISGVCLLSWPVCCLLLCLSMCSKRCLCCFGCVSPFAYCYLTEIHMLAL
jgi:hypothetical protein